VAFRLPFSISRGARPASFFPPYFFGTNEHASETSGSSFFPGMIAFLAVAALAFFSRLEASLSPPWRLPEDFPSPSFFPLCEQIKSCAFLSPCALPGSSVLPFPMRQEYISFPLHFWTSTPSHFSFFIFGAALVKLTPSSPLFVMKPDGSLHFCFFSPSLLPGAS